MGLYESRATIGDDVAYHGMMAAWDHDPGHVVGAFGSHYDFGCCLSYVAPPLKRISKAVRVWRGGSRTNSLADRVALPDRLTRS